jgi:hypothetical protein
MSEIKIDTYSGAGTSDTAASRRKPSGKGISTAPDKITTTSSSVTRSGRISKVTKPPSARTSTRRALSAQLNKTSLDMSVGTDAQSEETTRAREDEEHLDLNFVSTVSTTDTTGPKSSKNNQRRKKMDPFVVDDMPRRKKRTNFEAIRRNRFIAS